MSDKLMADQLAVLRTSCKPESGDEEHMARAKLWQHIFRHVDALEAENAELRAAIKSVLAFIPDGWSMPLGFSQIAEQARTLSEATDDR